MKRILVGAALVAVPLVVLYAGAERSAFRSFSGEAMATRWQIELPDRPGAEEAAADCFRLFERLDLELSEWKPESPLTAVNDAAGTMPVAIPEDLLELLERSVELGRETDGAFDVTWAALWGLWDFRSPVPRLPDADEIDARRERVDFRRLVLDRSARTAYLPEAGMKVGLGAIAKGYALDRAAGLLEAAGFRDFLLVGGGQVLARGARGERPWRIGLRDPRGAAEELFARLELADASVSTSADNESYFEIGGRRYHHVLDPRTGWPARGLRSATVLHSEGVVADALSTAVMVLGAERGLALAERLGAAAVLVDDRGRVRTTPGIEVRLEILRPPRLR